VAVEHRPAREDDRGNVHGRSRRQACRRRLVTARCKNDAIEGIAVKHFDESEVSKVAIQCRSGTFAGLLQWMDWKLERDTAAIAYSRLDAFGKGDVMPVTWD